MEVGQEFIPYKVFTGSYIPSGLMQYTGISASAKLVWARLARYAGQRGIAYPSQGNLAEECGISRRGCQNSLAELEKQGFIIRKGIHRMNTIYGFLMHPCLTEVAQKVRTLQEEIPPKPAQKVRSEPNPEGQSAESAQVGAQKLRQTGTESAHNMSHEESHGHESLSSVPKLNIITADSLREWESLDDDKKSDPRDLKQPMIVYFRQLTGIMRMTTAEEFALSDAIMQRDDWDVDIALGTMAAVWERARGSGAKLKNFNYFGAPLADALTRGEIPSGKWRKQDAGKKRNVFGSGI